MADSYNITIGTVNEKVLIQQNSPNSSQIMNNDLSNIVSLLNEFLSNNALVKSEFSEKADEVVATMHEVLKAIEQGKEPSAINKLMMGLKRIAQEAGFQVLVNQLVNLGV